MHDGTGCAIGCNFDTTVDADSTQTLIANFAASAAATGMMLRHDTSANQIDLLVGNSSGTLVVNVATPNESIPFNTVGSCVFAFLGQHYQLYLDGNLSLEGDAVLVPSAGDGQTIGRIGTRGGGLSWYYNGRIGECIGLKGADGYAAASSLAAYLAR